MTTEVHDFRGPGWDQRVDLADGLAVLHWPVGALAEGEDREHFGIEHEHTWADGTRLLVAPRLDGHDVTGTADRLTVSPSILCDCRSPRLPHRRRLEVRLMALPTHRVIGHKDYGNQPNGWAGRKTDPTYSMEWRRQRVAAFKPRNAPSPGGFLMALTDAEQDDLYARVKRLTDPNISGRTLPTAVRELHDVWILREWERWNAPEGSNTWRAVTLLRAAERDARLGRAEIAAYGAALEKLADAVAAQQGLDADELKAAVRDAIAESVVKVDVNVRGGDDYVPEPPPAT
jgi:hypothetical protein